MGPYTILGEISTMMKSLPKKVQESGYEIRVLMPKFGTINERRHKLHEVVRLSGMNIIVDDDDFPLIIKVASYPGARMQVYFLDNEEFFSRKHVFTDAKGKEFDDNLERMVFFCKGAIETVKKFGWSPDIVSCHGWFTSLIPQYIRTVYQHEPIFEHSKLLYTAFGDEPHITDIEKFTRVAAINDLDTDKLAHYIHEDMIKLERGAILSSDLVIKGTESLEDSTEDAIGDRPTVDFVPMPEAQSEYLDFYSTILTED